MSRPDVEVAVIGAGPYGLATAAHLKSAQVATKTFGEPMSFWQQNMPEGMKLRSPWVASHIAHPNGDCSLEAYAQTRGFAPHEQMPVGEFIRYGRWFQENAVPDVDRRKVARVERTPHGFRLGLEDGDSVSASRVVIAMGLKQQELKPPVFAGLPQSAVSHTCEHVSFDRFRGKRVAVVGRGQSACETATLLSEAGAEVDLVTRGDVLWLGADHQEGMEHSEFAWALRKIVMTRGAVGPFPLNWVAEAPALVHLMPPAMRADFNERCLRAKASGWLRDRFGKVRVNVSQTVRAARADGKGVTLDLDSGGLAVDHVILGTGYKIDVAKLGILDAALLGEIERVNGSPRLKGGLESTAAGLHFVGATAVQSFGPLMRFVWGAGFAARNLTGAVAANRMPYARRAAAPGGMALNARPSQSS
jgi:thioredoxin reductase